MKRGKQFGKLNRPHGWQQYWSKYPEGFTIIEALIDWLSKVNELVDNVNDWNIYLETFVEQFDENLQGTVISVLADWQESGRLEVIVAEALETQVAEIERVVNDLETWLTENTDRIDRELAENKANIEAIEQSFEQFKENIETEIGNIDISEELNELEQVIGLELNSKKDNREMKVHVFDFSLEYSSKCQFIQHNGVNIIIDFGDRNHSTEAIQKIRALGVTKIDYAIITHYHADHFGGLFNFLESDLDMSDTIFYLPPTPDWDYMSTIGSQGGSGVADWRSGEQQVFNALDSAGIERRFPTEKTWITLNKHGRMRFYNTLPEYFQAYYNDLSNDYVPRDGISYNNFSLVTEIESGDRNFLFTGDLDIQGQKQIAGTIDSNIYFYDVEHHGLNHGNDPEFSKNLQPEYAVIQNADKDYSYMSRGMYGHLKDQGTRIYVTALNGDITFTDTVEGMKVTTSRRNGSTNYGRSHSYSLAGGHSVIPRGTDLNNIMEAGTYISRTIADTASYSNLPQVGSTTVTSSFKLIVDYFHDEIRQRQTLLENSGRGYIWYRVYTTTNMWNPWFRVAHTGDL